MAEQLKTTAVNTSRSERLLLPAIIVITLLVYLQVAWHDFINFDDDVFVYENPMVAAGLTLEGIRWAFTTAHEVNWIPLSWLSHMLDVSLFGMNPGFHHLTNLFFHLCSTSLLYLFLNRTTSMPFRSGAVALLFALHPLHVESVAWIAERKDVLSAFFGMMTLFLYARYSEKPSASRYIATLASFVLGLLSKSMLVSFPVVLLLLDWWPMKRFPLSGSGSAENRRDIRRIFLEKIPFFLFAGAASVITYIAQQGQGELSQGYTLISRAGRAAIAYLTYLKMTVWPFDLAIIYPFSKYPPTLFAMLGSGLVILALSVAAFWLSRRYPIFLTGWLWYLVTLFPVSGIIQIGQHEIADRYTYIPLIGIFIILVWGACDSVERFTSARKVLLGLALLLFACMTAMTAVQLRHWKDGFSLFSHTVSVTNGNWVALNNLGLFYLNDGKVDKAVSLFNESIAAKPTYALAYLNLGAAYLMTKQYEKSLEALLWSFRFDPYNPKVRFGLGTVYHHLGEREKALAEERALRGMGAREADMLLQVFKTNPVLNKQ